MRFEIYKDSKREWRWRLRAGNNEIIAASEGYKRRKDCLHAVQLVQDLAKGAKVEQVEG